MGVPTMSYITYNQGINQSQQIKVLDVLSLSNIVIQKTILWPRLHRMSHKVKLLMSDFLSRNLLNKNNFNWRRTKILFIHM